MIELNSNSVLPGGTLTVLVDLKDNPNEDSLVVRALDKGGVNPFTVAASNKVGQQLSYSFPMALPGRYSVKIGNQSASFEVRANEDLPFRYEFGVSVGLILTLFGGVIWWAMLRNRRGKKEVIYF